MSRPGVPVLAASQTSPADKWVSRAAAATVVALAGLAGALSYSHMRQLAEEHGQTGWHAHAFPLSVDGLEIVASLVLLADHRSGRRPGWLPWAALATGTAGSLAANVATAGPEVISRIIAGWPALALLIAVKLLSGMLGQHPAPAMAAVSSGPAGDCSTADQPPRTAVPIPAHSPGTARPPIAVVSPDPHGGSAARRTAPGADIKPGTASGVPDIADLLPAARAARDSLHRDGHRLTRDALATRLRENGYQVRNSCLTTLLRTLRSESSTPPPNSTNMAA